MMSSSREGLLLKQLDQWSQEAKEFLESFEHISPTSFEEQKARRPAIATAFIKQIHNANQFVTILIADKISIEPALLDLARYKPGYVLLPPIS